MTHLRVFLAVLATLLALLTTGSAEAATNGRLPASDLARIVQTQPCAKLAKPAAAAYNTLQLYVRRTLPVNGCDSAYRTFARQVFFRAFWCGLGKCGNAAVPGTSNHGWGLAVDIPLSTRAVIDAHGRRFGWCKCWSDAPWEPWHYRYTAGVWKPHPNPGPNLRYPILREGSGGIGQARAVEALKRKLRRHKTAPRIAITGAFGSATRRAVIRFQATHKLAGDGIVGRATWKALRAPVSTAAPAPLVPITLPPKPGPIVKPDPVATPAPPVKGVDVSVFQGSIDWRAVKSGGFSFAIPKATEGQDFRDSRFTSARVAAIRKAGLVPGAYHFLRPRAGRTGAVEARWYVRTAKAAGIDWRKGHDIRPIADVETTTLGRDATCVYLRSFLREVTRLTGRRVLVYTFPSFGQRSLGCSYLRDYALWIAHYGVPRPLVPAPWTSYSAWQFTSDGRAPGIGGRVDLNVLVRPGTLTALRAR